MSARCRVAPSPHLFGFHPAPADYPATVLRDRGEDRRSREGLELPRCMDSAAQHFRGEYCSQTQKRRDENAEEQIQRPIR